MQFLLKNLSRIPGGGFRWKMNLPVLHRDYENILQTVSGEPYTSECLFVRGERSSYVQDRDISAVQALFPNAEIATVAGAGHWIHAEQPAELFTLVSDFLAR